MTSKDTASLLRKLESAANRLNAESDSLNQSISTIESQLTDANVGVEVWLPHSISSTDTEETGFRESASTVQLLGFAKVDGKWCIAIKPMRIVNGFFDGDLSSPYTNTYGAGEPSRLLGASRQLRISALERLPDLIELLIAEAERCRRSINEASRILRID